MKNSRGNKRQKWLFFDEKEKRGKKEENGGKIRKAIAPEPILNVGAAVSVDDRNNGLEGIGLKAAAGGLFPFKTAPLLNF